MLNEGPNLKGALHRSPDYYIREIDIKCGTQSCEKQHERSIESALTVLEDNKKRKSAL